ncbi:hypothetical protein CGRA01v4_01848 [Colletotrichum graminicola]|nr:hypothetical protein CGRA01v4_01848 [Colletotrichum graminicola]
MIQMTWDLSRFPDLPGFPGTPKTVASCPVASPPPVSALNLPRGTASRGSASSCVLAAVDGVVHAAVHDSTAAKGDEEHEKPVGDKVKGPEQVANGEGQVVLADEAVKGVEDVLRQNPVLLGLVLPQVNNVVRGGGCYVEALPVDVDLGSSRQHADGPDGRGACRYAVAEDGLIVTVQKTQVGRFGKLSEFCRTLVEGGLDLIAVTCRTRSVLR